MSDAIERVGGTVLALPQAQLAADAWTRERVDLMKKTVCPKGVTDTEFALFLEQCKRSGLDPLLKEAFCVPRRQNIGTRENPQWITKHEFQPGEAGMLARAERFPDYRGVTAAAVYSGDAIEIDAGSGVVSHRFSPVAKRGSLLGAWARLERAGKQPMVVWLDLAAYQQNTGTWKQMPATMIEKCARVALLRKAYPSAFGGLYIDGEPVGDGEEAVPEADATPVSVPRTKAAAQAALARAVAEKQAPTDAEIVAPAALPAQTQPTGKVLFERIVAIGAEVGLDAAATKAQLKTLTGKSNAQQLTEADVQAFGKWASDAAEPPPADPQAPPPSEEPIPF